MFTRKAGEQRDEKEEVEEGRLIICERHFACLQEKLQEQRQFKEEQTQRAKDGRCEWRESSSSLMYLCHGEEEHRGRVRIRLEGALIQHSMW